MADFVRAGSIVRRIWGDADTILLVFAGSAAEFALNRAVDWLFFTGALPGDPVGRVFSTARFARDIVFADRDAAERALARIRAIHAGVERARGGRIPDWAHRDVLYMLIDYSERAYALLHRPLAASERAELYDVFRRVGEALGIPELPADYAAWRPDRRRHLERDLTFGEHSAELYAAYRRHLGAWRYALLLQVQSVLAPLEVLRLLRLERSAWAGPALSLYGRVARTSLRAMVHQLLMPPEHLAAVRQLDAG